MPDLRPHRPSPTAPSAQADASPMAVPHASMTRQPDPTTSAARCRGRAMTWLRSTTDRLVRSIAGRSVVDRFAETVASALEPEEVRVELVRLAGQISGASKVELYGDRDGRLARRLAYWPPVSPHETTSEARSNPRGPIAGTIKERPGAQALQIPLKAGDFAFGSLRLTSSGRRAWSPRMVARLTTLCAIAATAERGLTRWNRGEADPGYDPTRGPHGSTILAAFLGFAQAQARRRHESLSLLEVAVDRLDSIRELLGEELAETAVERVSRAIKSTIRASDVVARLEEGRLAVLLPNATVENALKIAEAVRTAVARAGAASTTMPTLTASIGVATYPDHATTWPP